MIKQSRTELVRKKTSFQLPPCPQKTFHSAPTPQVPFSTPSMPSKHISPVPTPSNPFAAAPMPAKHISPSANTCNPLCICSHARKTHLTQCQHLEPHFQLLPCPENTFHPVPTPETPFATAPVPAKHILPSANTSNPLFNCPHALKTHFNQCQHLKPPLLLPPCPQNTFYPVPTPPTPFSTAPVPSNHISPSANTSNPLFNCPHAFKTHLTQCQYLKPPFQLPSCPQNTFHPVPTSQTCFSTPRMPSKHISPSANTSSQLCNCPHALGTHFTQYQYLKLPFQLLPCAENTFHPVPTPQAPFATAPIPSKHISSSDITSNPLFNCSHDHKTHFTQCQHLQPPFQLYHALKTNFTQCQHLKAPLQLPPCPQNTFYPVPTSETPPATAPMPSKHISPSTNTSNPLCNCPHALKTRFTQCQHLKPPFPLPPCPENTFHPMPTPQTPFETPLMPSKHISPSANTSSPL